MGGSGLLTKCHVIEKLYNNIVTPIQEQIEILALQNIGRSGGMYA